MANIALLNRCNLSCPYCFAHSYTGMEREDIDTSVFKELLDFVSSEGEVGIIGGEPFLHKNINELLELALDDFRIRRVIVFTNGIFMDKSRELFKNPKLELLVNVNSSKQIGKESFRRMVKNLEDAKDIMGIFRVSLGINIYKENQDFSEFLDIASKIGAKRVRVSLVLPQDRSEGSIAYFKRMKKTLLDFYRELSLLGACPCYDCNAIPECVFSEEEKDFLSTLPHESQFEREIFMGKRSVCSPVIDLYPDKTATRCFGMYDSKRVKIDEFKSINDLKNYFFKEIDCRLVNTPSCKECESCYGYKTFGCFGGCLAYKER